MPKDASPPKAVTLLDSSLEEMSKNERLKLESEGLFWVAGKQKHSFRSEIEDMNAGRAETLSNEGKEISKHFGIYKQTERVDGRKTHDYIFMVRMRVPGGGELSGAQWRAICEASDRFADGTVRLTTRQAIQFHHIPAPSLGPLVRFLNQEYPNTGYQMSTIAACGDVNRNTMCCVVDDLIPQLPLASRELAHAIAMELAPRSSAYWQIFLTDEAGKTETPLTPDEPIYGKQYLPRKFKVAIAHPLDNSVDMLTNDVAFLPVVNGGALADQYDFYSGGGMGSTHGQAQTQPLLALYLGRIPREQVVEATRAIALLQKEHGERADRRMARWKYTIRRLGLDFVKAALRSRFKLELKDAEPVPVPPNRFWHGWHAEVGGKWFVGIPVESGRVRDTETCRMRSAVSAITVELPEVGVRITGNQDLVLTHVAPQKRGRVEAILAGHGVRPAEALSLFRKQAFGCPALPTCGLAMTDAERAIPGLADAVEGAGLGDVDVVVRMAGCPNGCSRPPSAEIGITGYGKNAHKIAVGGSREGTRIGHVLYEKISSEQMVPVLVGILRAVRDHNPERLPAGEFLYRTPPERLRALVGVAL